MALLYAATGTGMVTRAVSMSWVACRTTWLAGRIDIGEVLWNYAGFNLGMKCCVAKIFREPKS